MTAEANEPELVARLRRHVFTLAGEIGPRNIAHWDAYERARQYVHEELSAIGLEVTPLPYQCGRHQVVNLEARIDGRDPRRTPAVVGAHYDTCGDTPGADDNASAVAGLIEIARLLRQDPPDRPVRVVAFANEEPPYFMTELMGSLVYARACRERGEKLLGMLCLEMIGYFRTAPGSQPYPDQLPALMKKGLPTRGNFLTLVSDTGSSRFTYRLRRKMGMGSRLDRRLPKVPVYAFALPPAMTGGVHMFSDHWSFREAGYQSVMATDTALVRNPHYHLESDTPDTLDYPRLAQSTTRLARAMRRV